MQTLNVDEVEQVNGGNLGLFIAAVGLCIVAIANADKLQDFTAGFLDGLRAK